MASRIARLLGGNAARLAQSDKKPGNCHRRSVNKLAHPKTRVAGQNGPLGYACAWNSLVSRHVYPNRYAEPFAAAKVGLAGTE